MSDTILRSAASRSVLLAANAFFVAVGIRAGEEPRRFRIDAMAEQDRFGARLLQADAGATSSLSRALPARHHHGLARPRLRSASRPCPHCSCRFWRRSACRSACISRRSWSASWCSPRCTSSSASRCRRRSRSASRSRVSLWIAYPLHALVAAVLSAELAAQWLRRARSCACSASARLANRTILHRRRDRRPRRSRRPQHGEVEESRGAIHARNGLLDSARARRRPTSWSIAPRCVTVNADDPPEEIVSAVLATPLSPACRSGATSRRTSSASCTPRTCCARSTSADGDARQDRHHGDRAASRGSCPTSARCPTSSRRSAGARPISRWWSTNTARSRGW